MKRGISNERQLGSYIHDARIQAGMTQANLALRAGVSRKWLIGLEQGVRTRAELGKIFDTLQALGLSMHFSAASAANDRESTSKDQDSISPYLAKISHPTMDAIRRNVGSDATLKALRNLTVHSSELAEAAGKNVGSDATLKALRNLTVHSSELAEAAGKNVGSDATLKALRNIADTNQTPLELSPKAINSKSTTSDSLEGEGTTEESPED